MESEYSLEKLTIDKFQLIDKRWTQKTTHFKENRHANTAQRKKEQKHPYFRENARRKNPNASNNPKASLHIVE